MAFIFGLGIRMVVLSSLLILILVATVTILYMSQFILPRSAATVLGPLLVTAAAIYLLRGTDFEKAEKVAVVVLVMALALAGSTSFASFVLTPSYDNTTMVVGGSEPGCPGSQTLTFDEEKFNLENGALGNHTEKEAKEAILSELDIEAADSEKKHREIAKFYEKLRKPLDEMESNDTNRTEIDTFLNLNKSETRRLSDAFEDALVAEVTSYHYGQSNVRVERLPRSISTNETLRFIAEKYDIQNPEIADEKPRRIRFFERKIDVEERFNPDRYYVVEGTPEDSDYESTHLLIVREVFFFRNTRLVRFQVGDC
jgi:hypothetical protein